MPAGDLRPEPRLELAAHWRRTSLVVRQADADGVNSGGIPLDRKRQHQCELAAEDAGCGTLIPGGGQVGERNRQLGRLQIAGCRRRELYLRLRELARRRVARYAQLKSNRSVYQRQVSSHGSRSIHVQRARGACRHLASR